MKGERIAAFWAQVHKGQECWLWTGKWRARGYGRVYAGKRGDRYREVYAHRYAWEVTHGPIPDGLWVLHRCDVPLCVRPDHLFLGTQLDNIADARRKRRHAHGERHGLSKLNAQSIVEIKQLALGGLPQRLIGARFGVSQSAVSLVVNGKRWVA